MSFFSNLFKKDKEELNIIENSNVEIEDDEITAVIAAAVSSMNEEEEIVAAITAAISCILQKSTSEFIVRSITRNYELDSIWALKGRMKLMR